VIRRVVFALAALLAGAQPLFAQAPEPSAPAPAQVGFLTRYAFHLNAEHLSSDDPRFTWDTNFGGDLDFVDYVYGRGTFYANFQAVLGEEFRAFDPSHGNYVLGGLASVRAGRLELAGGLHHESRHLSDRPKRFAIDWNMIGARASGRAVHGPLSVDARADLRGVIFKSYVDYNWELDSEARLNYAVRPRASVIAASGLRLLGTDGSRDRGTQVGFREEGGVRLAGTGAAIELIVAVERRIDPYPLEFGTMTWFSAGFRLVSR
jgi:hypothetical protein